MAASSRSSAGKVIWILLGTVIVLAALYTAGWFYAASALKDNTLALLGRHKTDGISADCADAEYRGFPFTIGLYCTKVGVDDNRNGLSGSFGALRSSALIVSPRTINWELDAPSEIRTSRGLAITSTWDSLKSQVLTKLGGVEQASLVIRGGKTNIASSVDGSTMDLNVGRTEIHMKQDGADLNATVTLQDTDAAVKDMPQFPRSTTSMDVTLTGRAGMIDGSDPKGIALYGTQGDMNELKADLGDGKVFTISGPFEFDDRGYLSAKFKVKVEQISAWQDSLAQTFPGLAPTLKTAGKMLSALGGGKNASLDVVIRRGKVYAGGFIQIGEIPPI